LNRGDTEYAPLFPYGYGLSFAAVAEDMPALSEVSGLSAAATAERGAIFVRGQTASPWVMRFNGLDGPPGRVDHGAQEDALALSASSAPAALSFETSGDGVDWSRESNGAMELSFFARSLTEAPTTLTVSMGCALESECARQVPVSVSEEWTEYRVSLSCFAETGIDMSKLLAAARFGLDAGRVGLAKIALAEDKDGRPDCGD
jgi:beta-glucosidase